MLQHAQDVASGAQDVNQQLQNHVQTVLGAATPTTPGETGGVQSLARPTPSPVLGAPSGDQNAPPVLGATTGAVNQPATAAATTAAPPDRTMSFQDYARAAAQRAGIDPNVFTAQIQQESGFNPSARSPAGAIGIAQFMPETAKGVNLDPTDPYASLDAAAAEDAKRLQQYDGDWGKTLASYNAGAGAVAQYGGIPPYAETQSYVKTIMGNAQKAADAAGTTISNAVQAGAQAVGGAASAVGTAAQQKIQDISQFGDKQLSADEAYAACGPAAAVRFAERFGRNPTLREATDLAKQVGWTSSGGMAGIASEQQLLKNMGVDTHIVAPDWLAIAKEAQTGNPVTISTPGHYYFADGYNPDTGAFHVGQSGLDLKNGAEWMTPQQMENLMGKAQGALFADNPNVPAKGATGAPTALGGTTVAQNAPITMGANQPARAPLVVEDQTPTPIRAAQDVLGAAGEAASQLGTTAQDLLAQAQELNRVQPGTEAIKAVTPILGGAAQAGGNAVSQVAQDVQNAAQGVLGAAQDVNRLTPGTTAVNAAAPVLGAAASDLGTAVRGATDVLGAPPAATVDQVRQRVKDAVDALPLGASAEQVKQTVADTLETLGPQAQNMGLTAADLATGGITRRFNENLQGVGQDVVNAASGLDLNQGVKPLTSAAASALDAAAGNVPSGVPVLAGALGIGAALLRQPGVLDSLQTMQELNDKYASSPGAQVIRDRNGQPLVLHVDSSVMTPAERERYDQSAMVIGSVAGPTDREGGPLPSTEPAVSPATSTDVAAQMQRNFLRDHRIVPNSDPRPQTTSTGLPNVKGVDQANLAEEVGQGVTTLYHETSVPNARALLDRIEQGPRTLSQVYTADNRDLALGQGGRGVVLEFDPARVNGSANANPAKQAGAAVGAGTEYMVDRSLPGAVKAIVVRNQRQADQLATNARVAARFDFANAQPVEGGGLRILRRERAGPPTPEPAAPAAPVARVEPAAPAANPYDLPRSAPEPDAAPLSTDAVLSHLEQLDQVHTQNDARIAELQNRLATGPSGRGDFSGTVVRPPWAAGWTNQGLEELARRNELNPYEANWWERGNFVQGAGEMREDVGQSGIAGSPQYRGTKVTQQSPTEMRAELARLQADQAQIDSAHTAIWEHAGQGGDVYAQPGPEALPFDRGGTDAGAAEAPRGPAPANAEAPVVRSEAGAGVPGAPRAPEPAARAEPAPAELAAFRAPETTPTAAETAVTGARAAPGETVTATTPTARVTARVGAASDSSSPELNRLNAMYGDTQTTSPKTLGQKIQTAGDNLTRAFTDRQVDINHAQERYAKNLGRPLRGDEMAAELQRLASDPVAQVKVDEGLKPAIQSVGSDYPALRNYVTLRSNIEVADNLASRTGNADVATNRLFSGGLNREQSAKALQDLETQLGPERFAKVQAAADQVTTFNNSLRQRLVQAGVLDEGTAAQLEAQYPNWAKTRILDYMADPAGGQGAGTKLGLSDRGLREYTLKGTERAREDPIASTVAYAHQVERMAMKNEAFNAFLKIDQAGENPMLHEVPQSYTPKSNETTMIGFVDGQKTKYVTDNKALGAAINGASVLSTPEWTSAWQKIFRSLATSRNPLFLAGNAALDIPTYVLRSSVREGGPQALPRILGELARGYGDAFQGLFQGEFRGAGSSEFLKGGGGQSGYFTGGEGQTKRAVAEMQRKNVFQIDGWQDLGRLTKDLLTLHPVEALGERIEMGPRVAAMRLAQQRGANPTQAIIDGRTVTVDFSQGGTVTKYLNNFIPFFNVGFQGPAQIARAFRDNPRAFVATVGTLIGIPSAVAEVWNRSDPQRAKDYADVPQYVKDQGVVVMLPGEAPVDAQGNRKPMYAVIKLREWMPFASLAREATARVLGDDSRSWQEMASSIGSGLSPIQAQSAAQVGTEPLGGIPILPAAAQIEMNTDFFRGRTIVTQRADQNASAAAKAITPAIQAIVDRAGINAEIRPSAIDFLVRNQGAGVGGAALSASDLAAGQPSDTAGATGTPGIGGLIGRFAGNQTGNELQQARDNSLSAEARQALRSNGITTTPGPVSSSVNQIPLKLDEETQYQQLANQYIDQAIRRTTASPDFATKTQIGKQSMIDQAVQGARAKAGNEVLNTIPAAEKSRRLKTKSTAPAAA